MRKVIGYLIIAIGALSSILSYKPIQAFLNLSLPSVLTKNILFYSGIVIILIGTFISFYKQDSKKVQEVPIYHGKEVVGYRRLHK